MPVLQIDSRVDDAIKLDSLLEQAAKLLSQEVADRLGEVPRGLVEQAVYEYFKWAVATACSRSVHHPGLPEVCSTWLATFGHKHM